MSLKELIESYPIAKTISESCFEAYKVMIYLNKIVGKESTKLENKLRIKKKFFTALGKDEFWTVYGYGKTRTLKTQYLSSTYARSHEVHNNVRYTSIQKKGKFIQYSVSQIDSCPTQIQYDLSNELFERVNVKGFSRGRKANKEIISINKHKSSHTTIEYSFGCQSVYRYYDENGRLTLISKHANGIWTDKLNFDENGNLESWTNGNRSEKKLEEMTVYELIAECKVRKIKGYSKLKKAGLIKLLSK